MHYIKVHITHKGVFPCLFLQSALRKHKDTSAWLISSFSWLFSLSVCVPPMVYVDCGNATANVVGAGCQKSCQTLDMECVSTDFFIPSWKHINQDLFYNYQLQLDSSSREMFQDMFSLWSLQYKTHCVSGCVCPHDQVLDGKGGCIAPEDCPCIHNGNSYSPGESIRVGCNTW